MTYTLPELVDLALCSPEVGAVNFNILRTVLLTIIEETDLNDIVVDIFEDTQYNGSLSPHSAKLVKGVSEASLKLRSSFEKHNSITKNVLVTGTDNSESPPVPTDDLKQSDKPCQDLLEERSLQGRGSDKIRQNVDDNLEPMPFPDQKLLVNLKQEPLTVPYLPSDENNIQSNHSKYDLKSPKKFKNSKYFRKLHNSYMINIARNMGLTDNDVIRTIETSIWGLQNRVTDLEKAVEELQVLSTNELSSTAKLTGDENLTLISNLRETTSFSSQVDGTEAGLKRHLKPSLQSTVDISVTLTIEDALGKLALKPSSANNFVHVATENVPS
ncbi:uncharacterized protein LOC111089865 [Limulus polyphemus]|uniref:Uncharacterized protein LOC111089865 n=1 Tax=Limulus polyphemus TaxID=6850 RepID=A0ABM1TSC7_LIMPO|nr:uncharacterized protein LOC111089865 [Limulus polyphemus]